MCVCVYGYVHKHAYTYITRGCMSPMRLAPLYIHTSCVCENVCAYVSFYVYIHIWFAFMYMCMYMYMYKIYVYV